MTAGRRGHELLARVSEEVAAGGAEQAIVADLGESLGPDVVQKAVEKRDRIQGAPLGGARAAVAVAEGDVTVVEACEAAVDDRHAKDVASEIVEHLFPGAGVLHVDDPFVVPDRRRRLIQQSCLAEARANFGAEEARQRRPGTRNAARLEGTQGRSCRPSPPAVTSMCTW